MSNTARIPDIELCGKTGTATNPHGAAHSAFVGFAPRTTPKIAVGVYVEFGVWGARHAAAIGSLIIEKYLTGTVATANRQWLEQSRINTNLLNPNQH
jgi:penicillin-binding protein 2